MFLKAGKRRLTQKFSFNYRCIDNVLSLNDFKILEFTDLIYPYELQIKKYDGVQNISLIFRLLSLY